MSWLNDRKKGAHVKDTLSLAIGIWCCTVPLIFFLSVVFFDLKVGLITVIVLSVIIVLVCNVICRDSKPQSEETR